MSLKPDWTRVELREIISEGPSNGYSPKSEHGATGTLTLKLSATTSGRFILNNETTKRIHETIAADSRFWLRPGDILIQRANTLEYVGTAALFSGPPNTYIYPDLMMRVRAGPAVDPFYLATFLNAPETRRALREKATGTAGNMPKVNGEAVRTTLVDLPPLHEQRRIVTKLEALQARSRRAREALHAVPPLLEKLRQSILAAAVRGDLTKDWRAKNKDVEPASKLLERIRTERRKKWEESELAKMKAKGKPPADDKWKSKYKEPASVDTTGLPALPEGWCWARADEVCTHVVDCHNKTAPYVSSGVPLIRTSNIRNGVIDLTETKFVDEATYAFWSRRCPPESGDVIFTREAPMGEAGMVPPGARLCMGQRMMLLRADSDLLRRGFLLYAVQAPHVGDYADRLSVGTGVRHLRVGDVEALPIPLAPSTEQQAVESAVEAAWARHSTARASVVDLRSAGIRLEQAILAKAFRGELVPQDPTDEPAAAVLKRFVESSGGGPTGRRRKKGESMSTEAR